MSEEDHHNFCQNAWQGQQQLYEGQYALYISSFEYRVRTTLAVESKILADPLHIGGSRMRGENIISTNQEQPR